MKDLLKHKIAYDQFASQSNDDFFFILQHDDFPSGLFTITCPTKRMKNKTLRHMQDNKSQFEFLAENPKFKFQIISKISII